MSPTLDAFLRSWPWNPWLAAAMLLNAGLYLRGWRVLRRRDPRRWTFGRLTAFFGGLAAIYLALASPVEPFAALLLQVHMVQHLLLMMVAPPLLWLGAPLLPIVRGLPEPVRTYWAAPLLRHRGLRRLFSKLVSPWIAGPAYVATTWFWHFPRSYELALSRDDWHFAEHVCFILSALFFWYPIVRPYPSRPRWSTWLLLPYLLLADIQNTVLAAWLTFSDKVLYPYYEQVPRIAGISALEDQATAGVLMWVPGSVAFLLPLFWIGLRLLFPTSPASKSRLQLPILHVPPATPLDLLRIPFLGSLLRRRATRRAAQAALAFLAITVIYEGLYGPQIGPMNLAGVLPWIHWRGVLILGLLIVGNVFCFACPFTLPRALARRLLPNGRTWPRYLRSKWLAVGLTLLFLWSYEAFALWDSPWLTAWIALAYFVGAFVIDSWFRGAPFCKYVCPIGQFNFVQSLVSPLEVTVREPSLCHSCRTHDCIRGNDAAGGCELHLFQPRKIGNLDCTFCLDCVRACPHENVGILATVPGRTLWSDPLRSGIGRLSHRPDLATLVLVLVFGAFANAGGMVAPVVEWQDRLRDSLRGVSQLLATSVYYLVALIAIPSGLVVGAAMLSRTLSRSKESIPTLIVRYSYAFVPIGFGMWLAHYSFHFFTSYDTIIPTTQRFAAGIGWFNFGEPQWQYSCCRPAVAWIPQLETLMLDCGWLLSLYTGLRITEAHATDNNRATQTIKAFAPWALLISLLFLVGVWIIFQPMQMRGTLPAGG
ncbi:MAG: cytochrome c oxidase assembly protein [Planctomycetia bacterium]|nr:cytochrome c oxidase assembly protein [Planctomycetia bacterium]